MPTTGTTTHTIRPGGRPRPDVDWLVVGSGFGGSVAALRLAEKGYRVAVVEQGRRYGDDDFPDAVADHRSFWAPRLGLRGIMRLTPFRHVVSAAQTGVGGGSLVYGGVLYRALAPFFRDPQWAALDDWQATLAPHYATAEWMLGARETPWESVSAALTREVAEHLGEAATFTTAPIGVHFGPPGVVADDPYFGGDGPPRTGCLRCGQCMVGCRAGAVNNLTKNYLWFAEKAGARILAERRAVDVAPLGHPDGRDGYRVLIERTGTLSRGARTGITAGGVVLAGGTVGTNELLAACKHSGSLPRISDHLGRLVRTNSEVCLAVSLPEDRSVWADVTTSSRVVIDGDTQIELLTYGPYGDLMRHTYTALAAGGPAPRRLRSWWRAVRRHPGRFLATTRAGWSSHSLVMLVMQARDNTLHLRARRRRLGRGYVLYTEADEHRPAPAHLEVGDRVAEWLAGQTGGTARSSSSQVFGGAPTTAHLLGGAVIGGDAGSGVVDRELRVFGYRNMIVCDGSAMPANPGVNPALTITALAEHAMADVPAAAGHVATTTSPLPRRPVPLPTPSPHPAATPPDRTNPPNRTNTTNDRPRMPTMNTNDQPIVTSYADAATRTVTAGGVTFAYRELGPKGGVPVVFFVHLAATLDNWDPRVVDAVARDHHVVAFDNRGVGASTGTVPGTVEAMADDAFTFLTALGLTRIDVLSFSLGGFIAQVLAERHPDLIRKLILTGTGPRGGKGIAGVPAVTLLDITRAALTRSDPKQFLFFNRNPAGKRAGRAFIERLAERTVDRDDPISVPAFLNQLTAITRWGLATPADLSKITHPTLIANGDHDRMVPSVLSRDLHHRIPGSELIIYPDSGHGGVFQYHDEFARAAVAFLDR